VTNCRRRRRQQRQRRRRRQRRRADADDTFEEPGLVLRRSVACYSAEFEQVAFNFLLAVVACILALQRH
jgi:hypothetical protein